MSSKQYPFSDSNGKCIGDGPQCNALKCPKSLNIENFQVGGDKIVRQIPSTTVKMESANTLKHIELPSSCKEDSDCVLTNVLADYDTETRQFSISSDNIKCTKPLSDGSCIPPLNHLIV